MFWAAFFVFLVCVFFSMFLKCFLEFSSFFFFFFFKFLLGRFQFLFLVLDYLDSCSFVCFGRFFKRFSSFCFVFFLERFQFFCLMF